MDINARIKWQPGMQLTSTTFSNLDENLEIRQQAAVRAANGVRFGRLPETEFKADGVFVQGTFEISQLKCLALLPTGCLISPDEPVSVRFPRLADGYAYLTVSLGNEIVEYEKEGVPYIRHAYNYEILPQSEVMNSLYVIPVARFRIEQSRCTIDNDFICPCLMFAADEKLLAWRDTFVDLTEDIANHANLKEGDGKQTMLRYLFRLRAFNHRQTLDDFLQLLAELSQAITYFIVNANGKESHEVGEANLHDVELWLTKVKQHFVDARHILDGVELIDDTIDFEALKAQLKEEIYAMLQPELQQHIDQSVQALRDDLNQKLSDALREYIDGTFRRQLEEALKVSLTDALRNDLYDSLYRALYDALFVPQANEDDGFMPLI